jgi:hypothetical protein
MVFSIYRVDFFLLYALFNFITFSPTCRSVCHTVAEEASVNSMIRSMATALNAELYAKRLLVHQAEKANWEAVLPIFYYNGNCVRVSVTTNFLM